MEAAPDPPSQPAFFADIRHECLSGVAVVAERHTTQKVPGTRQTLGFAALTVRSEVAFLSSLFVRREARSAGFRIIGQDAFCASGLRPFIDARCYVGSGSSLC